MIVVDSAAVIDALGGAAGCEELRVRLSSEELHAPFLLDYEVVSVVRGLTLASHISASRGEELLADFEDLPVQRWPALDALRRRSFELRHNFSSYDAAYIALAEALECPLVTRDARLERAGGHNAQVDLH